MTTLVYAPSVEVHIATADGQIIDVTADIVRGTCGRITGGVSTLSFDLLNQSRKYDGLFSPMDRIVCYMRRIRRMLVFSGYLNTVPLFSARATSIHIEASCTLKRLQNFLWDPGSAAAINLFQQDNSATLTDFTDGGVAKRTITLLNTVAGWPKEQIHIGAVPAKWFDIVKDVADKISQEAQTLQMVSAVGSGSFINGSNPATAGLTSIPGGPAGTGTLPGNVGGISYFGGPNGGAYGNMALTGESGVHPADPWYCAMRWGYQQMARGRIIPIPGVNRAAAVAWWKNRRILVVNPKTNKAVCVRAADWGPGITTRLIDVSPTAIKALGASTDDEVHVTFAPAGMALGPVNTTATSTTSLGNTLALSGVGTTGGIAAETGKVNWGDPDSPGFEAANIVTVHAAGLTFHVNRRAANRFVGFVNDLVKSGYQPKSIGGYNNRNIAGTSTKSNHAWGLAIDIDPSVNPRVVGTAPHKIPDTIVPLARKWGLGWGGEWHSSKDYMHFEVIGAPASPDYGGASPHSELEAGGYTSSDSSDTGVLTTGNIGGALFNLFQWLGNTSFSGQYLAGIRALMNDEPIFNTVNSYFTSAMRDFCSAPNGDIIGWFPDYFGFWGTAGKLVVEDVELIESFSVGWSDTSLKTHVFVTGSHLGTEGLGDASSLAQQLGTSGIASVEFPDMMKAFFNSNPDLYKNNGKDFLNRFGPRVLNEPMDNISGAYQEFFFAVFKFMLNWAQQFSATVEFTFMPEAFPGMLLVLPRYGVQCYISEVNHSFDYSGGFTTSITGMAWSTLGDSKGAIKALPKGAPL